MKQFPQQIFCNFRYFKMIVYKNDPKFYDEQFGDAPVSDYIVISLILWDLRLIFLAYRFFSWFLVINF